jgi:hypothetical protein
MRSSTGRRELAFVLALSGVGLTLVLLVAFLPWYPLDPSMSFAPMITQLGGLITDVPPSP